MKNRKPLRHPHPGANSKAKTNAKKTRMTQTRKSETGNWKQVFRLHRLMGAQALQRMRLAPLSSFMTILVLGITLSLPTALSIALDNLKAVIGDEAVGSVRISLYLEKDVTESDASRLRSEVLRNRNVASAIYVSPEQGLQEFEQYSGLGNVLSLLNENPLPGIIEVEPKDITPLVIKNLQLSFGRYSGVEDVRVDSAWLKRLNVLLDLGERTLIGLSLMIGLTALLIIGGITHLLVVSRRDEIQVVKLVGGSDGYVMLPFLYSGFWYGLLGGTTCWLIVLGFWIALSQPMVELSTLYQNPFQPAYPSLELLGALAGGTALIGITGSWLASWRQLRLIEP